MTGRPWPAERKQRPRDYIFNRARDSVESSHQYAGEHAAAKARLGYGQKKEKKRDDNK